MRLAAQRRTAAFTMVEIALCLAIVGFALVAIIGVLPTGMNVQKDNRQQTIINQDAAVWFDLIRNGARSEGFDDLTNYVVAITNYWVQLNVTNRMPIGSVRIDAYTFTNSVTAVPLAEPCRLTNGLRIVGLLSTPKYSFGTDGGLRSNYVVAYVRSMSGAVTEKNPQLSQDVLEMAFSYRMIVENAPYVPAHFHTNDIWYRELLSANSHDLRLTFRWPVLPREIGNGRQTYRQLTTGSITNFLEPVSGQRLHLFQPSIVSTVVSP